jgi:hypothetical protein
MRQRRITGAPASLRTGEATRRVNITILESHHDELLRRGVNVSGLIRELLDGHLGGSSITLPVDAETRRLYDEVMAGTGYTEAELGTHLRRVLGELLDQKLRDLTELKSEIARQDR